LGGITLRFFEVPGHCQGHLAILDEKNRNIFVGDALGDKIADDLFMPPFMPPSWDTAAFLSSVDKLKRIDYDTLCLSHFGCIGGSEARTILDEAVTTLHAWWDLYERNAARLSDTDYLLKVIRRELKPGTPAIRPTSWGLQLVFSVVTAVSAILGQKTALMDKVGFGSTCKQLAIGYRMATGKSSP
jgi:glyoxylase-like metal-dependent hydrolase (beta-lactamase superfamily II)